jgi:hypothetical protein
MKVGLGTVFCKQKYSSKVGCERELDSFARTGFEKQATLLKNNNTKKCIALDALTVAGFARSRKGYNASKGNRGMGIQPLTLVSAVDRAYTNAIRQNADFLSMGGVCASQGPTPLRQSTSLRLGKT